MDQKTWWTTPNLIKTLIREYGEETAKAYLRSKFQEDENIFAFAVICFSHHFTDRSPDFHKELLAEFRLPGNTAVAAPRGFGKSTMMMIDDAYDIVNANRHYIVRISDSYTQALEHMATLQNELEHNEILYWLYGDLKSSSWGADEFITATGVKVTAKGQGMKIRGLKFNQYRPDKINIDDLENDELVANSDRRKKLKRWFQTNAIPALDPAGKINYIGTVLHDDSLLSNIISHNDGYAGWNVRKYKALNIDLRGQECSLWPERFPDEYLKAMRDDPRSERYIGRIVFNQEYQNEPIVETERVVKQDWIKYYINPPDYTHKIITIDPAISQKETADYSAIQCWGLSKDRDAYCIERIKEKYTFRQLGKAIRGMYHRHTPDLILVEDNLYQAAIKEHEHLADLPVQGQKTLKDKRTRLIVVSKHFEAGRVFFRHEHASVVDEIINFGGTPHDDEMDAAVRAIDELLGTQKADFFFG